MSGAAISAQGLRRVHPKSGFTLDVDAIGVEAGQTLALLGPSGSGKTSLLNILGVLEAPDSGRVLLDGHPVTLADRAERRKIAAVFQRPYLFRGDVADNVGYGLKLRGVAGPERARRIAAALEQVGLAGYERRAAGHLSGGEAQRVSLARALAIEPAVLLLDEPLASLDPLLKRRLTAEFVAIVRDTGATVIWVTHDQDEALSVADHVAIMNAGRIVAHGPAEETMALPADAWTAAFLGMESAQAARVAGVDDGLVELQAGGGTTIFASGDAEPGEQVLFAVRPEDVLLFEAGAELPATTARNRLAARVHATEPRGATIRVTLDAGSVRLAASVSRASAAELGIAPGAELLAVFKATAVRWRLRDDETCEPGEG